MKYAKKIFMFYKTKKADYTYRFVKQQVGR